MKLFAPLRGRVAPLVALVIAQAVLAATVATLAVVPAVLPLSRHPSGSWALYDDGGRVLLDLARLNPGGLTGGALLVLLVPAAWALLWLPLGGLLPALFVTHEAPPLHRAAAYSLRRAPALALLALLAGTGYGLALLAGYFGHSYATRRALLLASERAGDLEQLWAVVPVLVLASAVALWHDVAKVQLVGDGTGAGPSAVGALGRMVRSPVQTLAAGAGYWLLGLVGVALATLGSNWLGGRPGGALVALLVVQQVAVAWRTVCRALWFAHLAKPWREGPDRQRP